MSIEPVIETRAVCSDCRVDVSPETGECPRCGFGNVEMGDDRQIALSKDVPVWLESSGETLRRVRIAKGISLTQMAAKVGVSAAYLSLIERNKRATKKGVCARLERELGIKHPDSFAVVSAKIEVVGPEQLLAQWYRLKAALDATEAMLRVLHVPAPRKIKQTFIPE